MTASGTKLVEGSTAEVHDVRLRCEKRVGLPAHDSSSSLPADFAAVAFSARCGGLLFVTCGTRVHVLSATAVETLQRDVTSCDDGGVGVALLEVGVPVSHVAVSCDGLTLLVACTRQQCAHAYLYDVRSTTASQGQAAVTAFCELRLSTSVDDRASCVAWNPVQAGSLAVTLSSGGLALFSVAADASVTTHTLAARDACASCVAWSRKGKQLVVGRRDGALVQYRPDLTEARRIPPPPPPSGANTTSYMCAGVLWLNTYEFMAGYRHRESSGSTGQTFVGADGTSGGGCQLSVMHVSAPKQVGVCYTSFGDPCFGSGERMHEATYQLLFLAEWNMAVVSCSEASELAVLACDDSAGGWHLCILDDDARAELPLTAEYNETRPLGVCVSTCSRREVACGGEQEATLPPPPLLHVLSTAGQLCTFSVINLKPAAAVLTAPAVTTDQTGDPPVRRAKFPIIMERPAASSIASTTVPAVTAVAAFTRSSAETPVMAAAVQSVAVTAATTPGRAAAVSAGGGSVGVVSASTPTHLHTQLQAQTTERDRSAAVGRESVPAGGDSTIEVRQAGSVAAVPDAIATASVHQQVDAVRSDMVDVCNMIARVCQIVEAADAVQLSCGEHRLAEVRSFSGELRATTDQLVGEVDELSGQCLQALSALEEARSLHARCGQPKLQHLLRVRPLSMEAAQCMRRVRDRYHYVSAQVAAVDTALDSHWEQFQQRQHEQPQRTVGSQGVNDLSVVYRLLSNNAALCSRLRTQLLSVGDRVPSAAVARSAGLGDTDGVRSAQDIDRLGDLLSAASINKSPHLATRQNAPSEARLQKLREVFSQRQTTPVRRCMLVEESAYCVPKERHSVGSAGNIAGTVNRSGLPREMTSTPVPKSTVSRLDMSLSQSFNMSLSNTAVEPYPSAVTKAPFDTPVNLPLTNRASSANKSQVFSSQPEFKTQAATFSVIPSTGTTSISSNSTTSSISSLFSHSVKSTGNQMVGGVSTIGVNLPGTAKDADSPGPQFLSKGSGFPLTSAAVSTSSAADAGFDVKGQIHASSSLTGSVLSAITSSQTKPTNVGLSFSSAVPALSSKFTDSSNLTVLKNEGTGSNSSSSSLSSGNAPVTSLQTMGGEISGAIPSSTLLSSSTVPSTVTTTSAISTSFKFSLDPSDTFKFVEAQPSISGNVDVKSLTTKSGGDAPGGSGSAEPHVDNSIKTTVSVAKTKHNIVTTVPGSEAATTVSFSGFKVSGTHSLFGGCEQVVGSSVESSGSVPSNNTGNVLGITSSTTAAPTATADTILTTATSDVLGGKSSSGRSIFGGSTVNNSAGGIFGGSTIASLSSTTTTSTINSSSLTPATCVASGGVFGGISVTSSNSVFGGISSETSSESIFGAASTSSGSVFGAASTSSGSIFGGSKTTTSAASTTSVSTSSGGSIFSGTTVTTSAGSLFGGVKSTESGSSAFSGTTATPTSSLFGGATTTTSGSLFGGATPTTSNSLFGGVSITKSGGSVFGGSTSTAASGSVFSGASTSSLFGGSSTTTSGSLFGSAVSSGGGVFGSGSTTSAAGTSVFTASSASTTPGSVFGGNVVKATTASVFGGAQVAAGSGSMFGGASTNTAPPSSTSTGFGGFGLGGGPSPERAGVNVFGGSSTFGQSPMSNLFSSSSNEQQQQPASTVQQSVFGANPSFGCASPPAAFGTAPTFGSTPAFGSPPAFGSSPAFGSPPAFGSTSTFGAAAGSPNAAASTFGSGGSVFGAASATPTFGGASGFGSAAAQSLPSFESLASPNKSSGPPVSSNTAAFCGDSFSSWR